MINSFKLIKSFFLETAYRNKTVDHAAHYPKTKDFNSFLKHCPKMSNHTCNGPFSDNKPSKELQPGPPFNQSTTGSLAGSFCDSTNLK